MNGVPEHRMRCRALTSLSTSPAKGRSALAREDQGPNSCTRECHPSLKRCILRVQSNEQRTSCYLFATQLGSTAWDEARRNRNCGTKFVDKTTRHGTRRDARRWPQTV